MNRGYHFETLQLHAGQEQAEQTTGARCVPIYQTASYVFDDFEQAQNRFALKDAGNIYSRITNPTQSAFEERIAALEGGVAALAVSSGSAAIAYTIQNVAHCGDHIIAAKNIYGGTYNLFQNTLSDFGVTTSFVDCDDLQGIKNAIKENTKAIFIESLSNPNSLVVDIESIAKIAHENGIILIVDNTFATPYLIRPIAYGADVVVHSATKYIGGHGTTLGGVIIDAGRFDYQASARYESISEASPSYHGLSFTEAAGAAAFITKIRAVLLRDFGACLSPIHSFIFLQGLETLSLRMERHTTNALRVVEFLENHPQVERVNHPSLSKDENQQKLYEKYLPNGGGAIFTFDVKGGLEEAKRFINNLELFSLLANVADLKSLVIHPATTTHSQLSKEELESQEIKETTIRLSIGTEHIDDIIADLEKGLAN